MTRICGAAHGLQRAHRVQRTTTRQVFYPDEQGEGDAVGRWYFATVVLDRVHVVGAPSWDDPWSSTVQWNRYDVRWQDGPAPDQGEGVDCLSPWEMYAVDDDASRGEGGLPRAVVTRGMQCLEHVMDMDRYGCWFWRLCRHAPLLLTRHAPLLLTTCDMFILSGTSFASKPPAQATACPTTPAAPSTTTSVSRSPSAWTSSTDGCVGGTTGSSRPCWQTPRCLWPMPGRMLGRTHPW